MKTTLLLFLYTLFIPLSLTAQFKFKVDGNAKIEGRLDLSAKLNSIFIGPGAGVNDDGNNRNVFIGVLAGFLNNSGDDNTFIGYYAGANNSSGKNNVFVGTRAGGVNTTGDYNSFLGRFAGGTNTEGSWNTFLGYTAGEDNTTGKENTFVGAFSGLLNTTGKYNSFFGYNAGYHNTTGELRSALGYSANSLGEDYDNSTGLGAGAAPTGANIIHVGNTSVTSIKGVVGFSTYSDARFKQNVRRDEVPGLAFIRELEPVTYTKRVDGFAQWKEDTYGEKDTATWQGKYDIEQITFTGFIAQEVEAAAAKIGYDFSGVDKPTNEKSFYALRYATFVVPLVQGMQEQQEQIGDLKSENKQLSDRVNRLEELVGQLLADEESEQQSATLSSIRLDQNEPNPFVANTRIGYFLPPGIQRQAELVITNPEGREIKRLKLQNKGEGVVEIDAGLLTSGIYQYALLLDGRKVTTRRMVRMK